jgi:acetolactate synthase-1/2/3 large subunit
MSISGGDLVGRTLASSGIDVAFGLHGGHLDSLLRGCRRAGIRLVDTRHEAAAVNAADGYARVTGRVGLALATAGAGFSNAIAGLGPPYVDRSPVLLITSSPPLRDAETNALQGFVDQVAMAVPVAKWAHRVTVGEEIPRLIGLALRTALAGPPGPVVLDIPVDVLFTPVDEGRVAHGGGLRIGLPPAPAPEGVAEALALLRSAQRPAIIAGGGVRGPAPCAPLVEFAERTGIPVFHPGMIVGAMPPDHALNGYSARNLATLVADGLGPDAVLLLGARFGFYLGGRGGSIVPLDAKVIQVDVDASELGRVRPFDVGITADARQTLRAFTAALEEDWPDRSEWAATATGVHRRPPSFADDPVEVNGRIHPYHGLREVLRSLEPHSTLVVDGGELSAWTAMSMHEARPHRAMGCGYLGFLGITPGLAIGAQVAEPDRRVVLVIGDGGAGFHIQEFDTMVRHGLPVVTVVVNNSCWGMSLHGQDLLLGAGEEIITRLADTDYDRVAAGFGAFGERVSRFKEIAPALKRALADGRPACINLAVSGDVVHPVTPAMVGTIGAGQGTVVPYYDNIP